MLRKTNKIMDVHRSVKKFLIMYVLVVPSLACAYLASCAFGQQPKLCKFVPNETKSTDKSGHHVKEN